MTSLRHKKLFVLDMDGTIYLGDQLFPWTRPFLDRLVAAGRDFLFLTNNSSRSGDLYVEKLIRLGVPARRSHVLTSGDATIELLVQETRWRRLFLVATPSVTREFAAAGFQLVEEDPDAVVLTFDTTLTYDKLRQMCWLVREGTPFVASHPDTNCPDPRGPIPDVGALLALVEKSTGRRPDRIIGKPGPGFLRAAMLKKGASADQTILIGDRLYTDIACGLAAGVTTGLVLSGETPREMVSESPWQPDFVFENLSEIPPLLD